uniref:T cell receptor alpha variable 8-3 n=1 Tax=Theropithecus gelada TaxID=9565 RepID=A0A8D2FEA4_THEGE
MLLVFIPLLGIHFVLRTARAQSVTQPDIHITVSEGASLELRCNYSYGATPSLFWYVQSPGQGLQLLLKYFSGDTVVQGIKGFEAEFKRSQYSFNLRKHSVHWSDAAEYFCAAGATVPGSAGGAEHKLPMLEKFSETQCIFLWHFQRSLAFRIVSEAKKAEHIQAFLYNSAIPAVSHVT